MNIDENTARLLMSEALKDKLVSGEEEELPSEQNAELLSEIFIETNDQKFSISGLLLSLNKENAEEVIEIQNRISITDAHEIFSLLNNNSSAVCTHYSLTLFQKNFDSTGPFKVSLKNISGINYKTSQCTICFELVRFAQ